MPSASDILDGLKQGNALHLQTLTEMKEESNKLFDAMVADARKANEELEKELREVNDRMALRYAMNPGVKVQIRGSICDAIQEIKQLLKDITKLNDRYVKFHDSTLAQSKSKIAKIEEDANDLFLFQQAQDVIADVRACDGIDQELRERVEELWQDIDRAAVKKAAGPSPIWEKKAEEMETRDNLLSAARVEYVSEKSALIQRLFRFKCAREALQELLD